MSMHTAIKLPGWYWVISGTGLVWTLIGVMTYVMTVTTSPEALAELPEAEQLLIETLPSVVISAYAVAVFSGVLGCVALLLRKRWSISLFIISFIAILIQMSHTLFISDHLQVYGPSGGIVPGLVVLVAAFLAWFSRYVNGRGWIS